MPYECIICNKTYKSSQSLWNHKNRCHSIKEQDNKKYYCMKCGKSFNHSQSKWRHETQKCKPKINLLENEIIVLKNEINELKLKPNIIVNNTTQNYNTQNNIIISALPGCETIENLSNEEKKVIMNKGLRCLVYLIETTNFNKNNPKHHSYCVTSLNDKHASMIDTKTNSVIKTEKCELFDKVLSGNLKKLEHLSTSSCFTLEEKLEYISVVERLKKILFTSKRGIKKYYNEINLLSYNNKEMVYNTWKDLDNLNFMVKKQNEINYNIIEEFSNNPSDYFDLESEISSDEEVNTTKILNFKNNFTNYNIETYPVKDHILCQDKNNKINNNDYILDGYNVYVKKPDNTKGELYGICLNGKNIKKSPSTEINV